jgi:hypothetical protein
MRGFNKPTRPSWCYFGLNDSIPFLSRLRQLFRCRAKQAEYPLEKPTEPYRHIPAYAAEGFLETATPREMKRREELAQGGGGPPAMDLISLE